MTRIKTQNLLSGVISGSIPSSGDFSITLSQAPTYTKGFIVFDVTSSSSYESVYFHDRIGNVIYVKAENRPSPKTHSNGASFQMNNTAELINYLSDNTNTFGYVEKTGGLTVSVWGGNMYDSGTRYSVSNTSLTLPASQTNYIYVDTATRTIKQTLNLVTADAGILLATVISGASSVSSISQEQPFVISGPAGDMDSSVYDPAGIVEQLVGLTAAQTVSNKSLENTNHINLDTTPTSVPNTKGTISWNVDEETADLNCGTTNLQLGQELVWNCRNNSGATIADGSVVYATGTIGNSGRITIGKFIADGSIPSYYSLGVATETIANGADGKVTHFGKVRGINTTGASVGETWADGDLLYASPTTAGAFTKVKPEGANQRILMAMVIHAHSNGTLAVRIPTQKQFTKAMVTVGRDEDSDYVCDGVSDNVQIQAAIDAMTVNGGTVFIKRGTYTLGSASNSHIQLKSNVRLIGEGAGTIIKAGGSHGGVIYQGASIVPTNSSIENLVLDANNISTVSGIQIFKFNGLIVKDVTIKNVDGVWGAKFGNFDSDATVLTEKSYDLYVDGLTLKSVVNTTLEGLILVNTRRAVITNSTIKECDLINASLVSIFLQNEDVIFSNNHLEDSVNDYGLLDLTGCRYVTVSNNTFRYSGTTTGGNSIVNRNTYGVAISGNTFTGKIGNTGGTASGAGIIVLDWSSNIDGHTNPQPYTEGLAITGNNFSGFYYSVRFQNPDSATNCGWSNITITSNNFIDFNYSGIAVQFVSGRSSKNWTINGNNFIPLSTGIAGPIELWVVGTSSYKFTYAIVSDNHFAPTTGGACTNISIAYGDHITFGTNKLTPYGAGTRFSISNSTNVRNVDFSSDGFFGIGTITPTGSFDVNAIPYNPGTVAVSGTTVTGTSTEFTKTFKVGDTITTTTGSGSETKEIATIVSDTSMTTVSAFTGTNSGATYTNSNTGSQFVVLPSGSIRAMGTTGLSANNVSDWIYKADTVNITGTQLFSAFRDRTTYNQTTAQTGAINTFAGGPRVSATGTGSFSNIRSFNAFPTVLGTNTGNITGLTCFLAQHVIDVGATGTISNMYGFLMNSTNSSTTNTVSNMYGVQIAPVQAGGTLTYYAGVSINSKPAAATNASLLLIGTTTIPSGNYAIYNSSTNNNYFAGNTGFGTTTPTLTQETVVTNSGGVTTVAGFRNNATASGTGVRIAFKSSTASDYVDPSGLSWIESVRNVSAGADMNFGAGGSTRLTILSTGSIGINETAPDYKLDVNGSFGFTPGSSVTPVDNGDVVIEATSNTTLTFKLKGSDGTVRSGTVTLS